VPATVLMAVLLVGCSPESSGPPQFVDIAQTAGVRDSTVGGPVGEKHHIIEANTGGAALIDYDRDGDLDVFLVNGWRFDLDPDAADAPSARLYRNDGGGRFTDVTLAAGIGHRGWGMGCAVWDADGDDWPDLFLTVAGRDVYYHNEGDGHFVDRADAFFGDPRWSTGIGAADYDGDGDVDVYVASYVDLTEALSQVAPTGGPPPCTWRGVSVFCGPSGMTAAHDVLQFVDDAGVYHDRSDRLLPRPEYFGFGVIAGDFDADGDADIYVADDSSPNLLYRNNDGLFEDIAAAAGVAVSNDGRQQAGMGIAAGDVDGDGGIDFVVSNFSHDHVALYASRGTDFWEDASYTHDVGRRTLATLGWGMGLFDADNDADLDLFVANGHVFPGVGAAGIGTSYRQANQLFDNDGGRLWDISQGSGSGLEVTESSRGAAFGDIDNDGDVDIVVINLDAAPSLLRNDGGNRQGWLSIQLRGTAHNRSAIGATVEVTTEEKAQRREVRAGTGYLSQDDLRLHFGLGAATVATVRVRWSDGSWQDVGEVAARQELQISRQGESATELER
jgi:enediyne biosynthesis protein E4